MQNLVRVPLMTLAVLVCQVWAGPASASGDIREYILIVNRQPTDAPTTPCSPVEWLPRPLTVIDADDTGQVSLSNDRFTLPAGTYEARMRAPLGRCVR